VLDCADGGLMSLAPSSRVSIRRPAWGLMGARWNKQGFRPPQETWFQRPLLAMAEDLLHSRSLPARP